MPIDFSKHKKGDVVRVHCCDSCARAAGIQPKCPPDSGSRSWPCEVCGHWGIGSATDCTIGDWLILHPNKRLTAETSNARGKVEYEYEVWQDDALQAGGIENDYASAQSEANHYAMMYAQDGPVEVRIYEKRLLSADKVQPKRRRYDPSGSLSEYGIFPECDAQPLEHQGDK